MAARFFSKDRVGGIIVLVAVIVGLFLFLSTPKPDSDVNYIVNFETPAAPSDQVPSPLGKYFKPGDVLKRTESGYEIILGSDWLKEYHGGYAHFMQLPKESSQIDSVSANKAPIVKCGSSDFVEALNRRLNASIDAKLNSMQADNLVNGLPAIQQACLSVDYGRNVRINDGGHQPENDGYRAIGASALLAEMKSKAKFLQFGEKLKDQYRPGDEIFIVDEAFILFGGQYAYEFSEKLNNDTFSVLREIFGEEFERNKSADYSYDDKFLSIDIDPFVRKNYVTLSWKIVPLSMLHQ